MGHSFNVFFFFFFFFFFLECFDMILVYKHSKAYPSVSVGFFTS